MFPPGRGGLDATSSARFSCLGVSFGGFSVFGSCWVHFIQRQWCFPESQNASFDPSKITRKKSVITYSPTTGTCQMSLFASPTSSEEQKHRNGLSNEKRKKLNHPSLTESKESTTKDNDEFMMLLSKVEKLSEEIMEIMQNLSSIQALEGSRELENLIGISCASHFLKREMQKTKELMTKVNKQKLFEKSTGLPHKESRHLDSYEFLKAILN
ncbi:centromere protein R isoform X7 [Pan troglodytes]|uniref:centromere protein R isoform X7 n=1 Tax=Pan troglodytes TaxID=9598 RepID=UPI0030131FE1